MYKLKKIMLALVLVLLLSITACGSDKPMTPIENGRFEVSERQPIGNNFVVNTFRIIKDTKTGEEYMVVVVGFGGGIIKLEKEE